MRICLDAGHYGKYNRSPVDGRYYESDMVWKLHLLQKRFLEECNVEVILTRGTQEVVACMTGERRRRDVICLSLITLTPPSRGLLIIQYRIALLMAAQTGSGWLWPNVRKELWEPARRPGLNTGPEAMETIMG